MHARLTYCFAVIACTAFAASSDAAARCTVATLRGAYGFTAQGVTVAGSPVPPPLQGPFASLGTAVYDGRGGVVLTASATFNGLTQSLPPVKGTYQVNTDCTFTSTLENGATFFASIAAGGRELFVLQTTPGVIASGTARFQTGGTPSCRNALSRGVYGFISQGTGAPPTVPPPAAGPLQGVGTVAFSDDGSFALTAVRSVNGIIDPEPLNLAGRYAFTDGCNFEMRFDVGFTFLGTLVDGGSEVLFLETDPGTTFVVRAKRM
jgi:hypothetical protein